MCLACQRVVGMQHGHQRVFAQRKDLELRWQRTVDSANAKINLPALQVTRQRIVGAIKKLHPQTRKRLSQCLRQQWKQQRTHRRHQPDTHRAVAARFNNLLHIVKRHLRDAQHALGVRQYGRPKIGERDRRGGTINQLTAQHRFNLAQGAAQRRLANRQAVSGIGKVTQLRQRDKILQLFKRERRQSLPGIGHDVLHLWLSRRIS